MPRFLKIFFMIGYAICSVVPGATVVSIRTSALGGMFSAIVAIEASSAAMSADQFRRHMGDGGHKRLLLIDAWGDELLDLGVLGFHGRIEIVKQPDLPEAEGF